MELSKDVVDNINFLKQKYERNKKLADYAFIREALDIVASTSKFKSVLSYDINDCIKDKALCRDGKIIINPDKVIESTLKEIEFWGEQLRIDEIIPTRNMHVLALILHEATHVWDDSSLSDYDEVNRLYKDINEVSHNTIYKIIYYFCAKSFPFERHANLCALKILAGIYDEESSMGRIARMYYLDLLIYLYEKSYPIKKTLKRFHLKDDYDLKGIPFLVQIENGFNIEKEKLEYVEYLHDEYINFETNYEDVVKKIKEL